MTDRREWPALPLAAWQPTRDTLHLWTQVVGKIRLALTPLVNHWWNVPLYVSARGLTTSPIPYGSGAFEIAFDFIDHELAIETGDGRRKTLALVPRSVAEFHREVMRLLGALEIEVHIWRMPVEISDPMPFDEDQEHASYDPRWANRFFRVLAQADRALKRFMGGFYGKQSPCHFFWGSFDLAQSRFCGRRAPPRPGADVITREAYSHEVMSVGFWPGSAGVSDAAFYAYHAPEPPGFKSGAVRPAAARYHPGLSVYVLPLVEVSAAAEPRRMVLEFCESAYDLGASLAGWDRAALDRRPSAPEPPGRKLDEAPAPS